MRVARTIAGPLLIAVSVIVVLHDYAFLGQASPSGDLLRFFSPRYCFLGDSLAAGTLPTWNPYMMGGAPFIGDPLSGWGYLPPMLMSWALPCELAVRAITVLNPLLAGWGIYWFSRSEGLNRVSGTVGGLSLALTLAASATVQKLHFTGSIAWTAVALAATSRAVRSQTWAARLPWAAVASLALTQVAAAFLSHGLLLAGGALLAYLLGMLPSVLRERRELLHAVAVVALIGVAFPLVGMAFLLPVSSFVGHTILADGYQGLVELSGRFGREVNVLDNQNPMPVTWPLRLSLSPGAYIGAAPLLLMFGGCFSRRRALSLTFLTYGILFGLLSSDPISERLGPSVLSVPLGDVYAHASHRLSHGVTLAVAVLAALGVQAWCDEDRAGRRLALIAPGVLLWLVVVPSLGAPVKTLALLFAASAVTGLVLARSMWRSRILRLLPLLLAIELVANGLIGQEVAPPELSAPFVPAQGPWRLDPLAPLADPQVDIGAWMAGSPLTQIVAKRDGGRLLDLGTGQRPRALFLNIEIAEGYSSLQLRRYWSFVRALEAGSRHYNLSTFHELRPIVLDAMQIRWVISPRPLKGVRLSEIASDADSFLYEMRRPVPRAEVVSSWTVTDAQGSLQTVTRDAWRPSDPVMLEADPGIDPSADVEGNALYESLEEGSARVTVSVDEPAMVMIRNAFHPGWRATVDGEQADVIPANYVDQAVAVPAGDHVIALTYVDPTIKTGLVISALTLLALLGVALYLRRSGRRARRGMGSRKTSLRMPT